MGGDEKQLSKRISNRTKGIYAYSVSPFYQRPFSGYLAELWHIGKHHFRGSVVFCSLAAGGYLLTRWANQEYHRLNQKDLAKFEAEFEAKGETVSLT